MDTVRIGIIGIGGMGSMHARYLNAGEVSNAKLTAVCDINPERLKWAKENLADDVQTFDNADAFFAAKACDAVMVATPHYDHPPLIMKAFENGMHGLSEKPAGVYTKQVREMNEAAAKSGKVFGLMFNQRTIDIHKKIKDVVESGELGEIYRNNWIATAWFRSQSYYDSGGWRATWEGEGGGVLINQCPHHLDLWQWICGMPKRVLAFCSFGKYHNIEVEDDVTAYVEYENGSTGTFMASTGEAPGTNRLEIVGDMGKLIYENGQLKFYRNRTGVKEFNKTFTGGFGGPESWTIDIPADASGANQHRKLTQDWVNAITKGTTMLAPGEEGIRSLTLSNAMQLSTWINDWVDLPIDEELYYEKLQEQIKNSTFEKAAPSKTMDVDGSF